VLLPVPGRFDRDLFQEKLEVTVETVDHGLVRGPIELPERGQCRATIELSKHPVGYLSGVVRDGVGRTVSGSLLMIESADERGTASIAFVEGGRTDKEGRFHLKGRKPFDRARIVAFGEGVGARTVEPVTLPRHGLELVLAPTGSIRAKFALQDLAPKTEVLVEIAPPEPADSKPIQSHRHVPDPGNPLNLDGLPIGPYVIRVVGPQDRVLAQRSLVIQSGQTTDLTLQDSK
jgi:hypothetical protein